MLESLSQEPEDLKIKGVVDSFVSACCFCVLPAFWWRFGHGVYRRRNSSLSLLLRFVEYAGLLVASFANSMMAIWALVHTDDDFCLALMACTCLLFSGFILSRCLERYRSSHLGPLFGRLLGWIAIASGATTMLAADTLFVTSEGCLTAMACVPDPHADGFVSSFRRYYGWCMPRRRWGEIKIVFGEYFHDPLANRNSLGRHDAVLVGRLKSSWLDRKWGSSFSLGNGFSERAAGFLSIYFESDTLRLLTQLAAGSLRSRCLYQPVCPTAQKLICEW